MILTGINYAENDTKKTTAFIEHWRKSAYKDIDAVIKIIISTKNNDNNKCIICDTLSVNWKSKASLAAHYRYSHRSQIVEYYLENIINLTPDELQELMKIEEVS